MPNRPLEPAVPERAGGGAGVRAYVRAAIVLATAADVPVLAAGTRLATSEPRFAELAAGSVPATLVRPGDERHAAPLVLVNGVTARGRMHPDVRRLAAGLARAGFRVLVPDPRGLAAGELTQDTLADTVTAVREHAGSGGRRDGGIGLVGISAGASLALLAAADASVADRVTVVAGTSPYADLTEVARIATTGTYRQGGRLVPWRAPPFLGLVIARSLVAGLAAGADRENLRASLVAPPAAAPLSAVEDASPPLQSDEARALAAFLGNRDPERFDELAAALSARLRQGLAALSPLTVAPSVRARVELVSAPRDAYFPLAESRALAIATGGRLTTTLLLEHADPALGLRRPRELERLVSWVARSLAAAAP
jgi:pimeloyl-ACP methyl ester carboxylesterase